jgi:hypothetical protein
MSRPYRFGVDKVHPVVSPASDGVTLNAPWSAPRGYTTSIPEEVAAYKARLPQRRTELPHPKSKKASVSPKINQSIIRRAWTYIRNHFKGIADDVLPQQTAANPNGDVKIPRLLVCLCCMKAETS